MTILLFQSDAKRSKRINQCQSTEAYQSPKLNCNDPNCTGIFQKRTGDLYGIQGKRYKLYYWKCG